MVKLKFPAKALFVLPGNCTKKSLFKHTNATAEEAGAVNLKIKTRQSDPNAVELRFLVLKISFFLILQAYCNNLDWCEMGVLQNTASHKIDHLISTGEGILTG